MGKERRQGEVEGAFISLEMDNDAVFGSEFVERGEKGLGGEWVMRKRWCDIQRERIENDAWRGEQVGQAGVAGRGRGGGGR